MEQQYSEKMRKLGYCQLVCDIFSDWESVKDEILLPDRKDGSGNGTIHVFLGTADCDLRKEFPDYYQSVENGVDPEIGAVRVKHYFLVSNIISMLGYVCQYYFEKKENVNDYVSELLSCLLSFENQDGLISTTSLFKLSTGAGKLRPYFKQFESSGVFAKIIRKLLLPKSSYKISLFKDKENNYAAFWLIGFPQMNEFEVDANNQYLKKNDNEKKEGPLQIIYYGVPGCGKSHQIQEDLKKKNITEENHQVKRVVFHPDYCNADFVGQILPVTKRDGGIRYQFKAGPFTKILRDAYANPDKEYALIIEEINRGNAAAIFGDLFQLLDRKRESDPVEVVNGNSYGPGWSDYCVENDYINAYFRGAYDGEEAPNPLPPKTLGNITFNDNVDIRLPPNLSLYATMNTSDQNVFTLDNAFQRRWEMKQISNDLKNDDAHSDEKAQYDQRIGNTGVKWGVFRDKINEIIMQSAEENGLSSMEDKRLGGWFIVPKKASDAPESAKATITSEAFAEKVLKYLWDDAFKFDRKSHFGNVKTLEKLIEKFKTDDFKVFSDEQISGLSQNGSANTQTGTSES